MISGITGKVVGTGSIRRMKDKNGNYRNKVWRIAVSLERDPITHRQKQITKTIHGTKADAQRALEKLKQEIESGLLLEADKVPFDEYADQWFEARKASGRYAASTHRNTATSIKKLKSYFGSLPLRKITPPMIRDLYIELANSGICETSASQTAIQLNQILEQAVKDNILLQNPCKRVESPKQRKSNVAKDLSKDQISLLISKLNDYAGNELMIDAQTNPKLFIKKSYTYVIKLILATGLRRGEALALSWKHVILEDALIQVRYTLDGVTGKPKTTKTESGIRDISIDQETVQMLAIWKQLQKHYLNSLGIEQGNDTPVFTREDGEYVGFAHFGYWWRSFRNAAGFNGLRIHDLRHTHATLLISSNLNMKAVSARLGHSKIATTMDLYAHALREDDIKAAGIIEDLLQADDTVKLNQYRNGQLK